jgi:hypothetical protein
MHLLYRDLFRKICFLSPPNTTCLWITNLLLFVVISIGRRFLMSYRTNYKVGLSAHTIAHNPYAFVHPSLDPFSLPRYLHGCTRPLLSRPYHPPHPPPRRRAVVDSGTGKGGDTANWLNHEADFVAASAMPREEGSHKLLAHWIQEKSILLIQVASKVVICSPSLPPPQLPPPD